MQVPAITRQTINDSLDRVRELARECNRLHKDALKLDNLLFEVNVDRDTHLNIVYKLITKREQTILGK